MFSGTNKSDVDICMFGSPYGNGKDNLIRMLAEVRRLLKRDCSNFHHDMELVKAKVPILKIYDQRRNIEIDISCSNDMAVRNTYLLFCYSQVSCNLQDCLLFGRYSHFVHIFP